ncbi:DegT/DnrJ/EryC1/StrS family aminotransferase [Marinobacter alexandrii]|uniref:DegT/DnrJ/EryC1/StrS family aminotransferase n=1 Tax=Marinobacter alexandrii TaxID=2570351 RepID=UPI00329759A2
MTDQKFYPISRPALHGREVEYVTDAVKSGWVSSLGAYVNRFEEQFAAFCGVKHAISVSNGTVALHLALHAKGIGRGDEVIMPDLSFIATCNATMLTGAKPVFCDVDEETLCLDPTKLEELITPQTRAIIPVHLYGHPANMEAINAIAERHDLFVLEDAAEAHGSAIGGARVGSLGHAATFSFYANKNLTTGEGGMVTTNDDDLAAMMRTLRDHSMSPEKRYWHNQLGFNYRMTNLQAALGCAQLEQAEGLLEARRELFGWYEGELGNVDGVRLNRTASWASNTYWVICAEIDGMTEQSRDVFMRALRAKGVDTRPYFYPMSRMPYTEVANTPVAHAVAQRGINLPTYIGLSKDDVADICERFKAVLASGRYV